MSVNKVTIVPDGANKQINIPVRLTWDYLGMDMAINEYETQVIKDVVGVGRDFEVSRFAHAPATGTTDNTEVNYEFYFYSGGSLDSITSWNINYMSEGFTPQDLYYYNNNFSNSFFKLDLYDTPDEKRQINYLTIIIPTQQGLKMDTQMQRIIVSVKKPKFILDYVGDKEGFFLYWLKKRTFLDIDTFYMSAKFYNAKTGQFTKMMTGRGTDPIDNTNGPQSNINPGTNNKYLFDNTQYFYYTVKLDYLKQTYQVFNTYGQRLGTNIPIKWYEYVNPPQ
jgi:hypothetical protein